MLEQSQSFFFGPDLFYVVAQTGTSDNLHPYFDITQGNNLYYSATKGWDYATGFGTPNLSVFSQTLLARASNKSNT